jgi:ribosomal protein S18 acetylase RimI-like enzyme
VGTLRRAGVADADTLVRLRGLMHQAMGDDPAATPGWATACRAALVRRLAEPDRFAGFLVEVDGVAVSGGVGWLEEHLPSPHQLDGRRGHIASMSTEPGHQRAGHGQTVLTALLRWFDELGVLRIDLRATPDGLAMYQAAGFRLLGGASMAWTAPHVRPGMGYRQPPR